jgi:hypothetical protein
MIFLRIDIHGIPGLCCGESADCSEASDDERASSPLRDMPGRADTKGENEEKEERPLRSCWELASIMQFITIYKQHLKIVRDIDMKELEAELCSPHATTSALLASLHIALLKGTQLSRTPLAEDTWDMWLAKWVRRNARTRETNFPVPLLADCPLK